MKKLGEESDDNAVLVIGGAVDWLCDRVGTGLLSEPWTSTNSYRNLTTHSRHGDSSRSLMTWGILGIGQKCSEEKQSQQVKHPTGMGLDLTVARVIENESHYWPSHHLRMKSSMQRRCCSSHGC